MSRGSSEQLSVSGKNYKTIDPDANHNPVANGNGYHSSYENGSGSKTDMKGFDSKGGDDNDDDTSDGETGCCGRTKDPKKDAPEPPKTVGFFTVFKYSNALDRLLILVGSIAAMAQGAGLPLMIIIFGDTINSFTDTGSICSSCASCANQNLTICPGGTVNDLLKNLTDGHSCTDFLQDTTLIEKYSGRIDGIFNIGGVDPTSEIMDKLGVQVIWYIILGSAVLVTGYIQIGFWSLAALRQSHRIKMKFFSAILNQNIGWFDCNKPGELSTRLADDIDKIESGIGDKLSQAIQGLAGCVSGFAIGLVYGWKLTLVLLAVSPLLMLSAAIMGKVLSVVTSSEQTAYAKAGAVAEEVLSSIRTVFAFDGQDKESERYGKLLSAAAAYGVKKGMAIGLGMGFVFFCVFGTYALGFWYGSTLVLDPAEDFQVGTMLTVFFAVIIGSFSLGNVAPNLRFMADARGAAYAVYEIIDRKPLIDSRSEKGDTLASVEGTIQFNNVVFEYPSREGVTVLDKFSATVPAGKTVAIVGASGCGKSTTVQLIQRFYDPQHGSVTVDGHDIRKLNVRWWRSQVGVVNQEPVLFATTIAENIRYGREGVTMEDIYQATKEANAFDFIMGMPDKFDTQVGDRGAQLSGGQKQRIAIARALVNRPKILLLDEATSALDTESEATVQAALEKASEGRTTIIIAHRLSTIQSADFIIGIDGGKLMESGTHSELMAARGLYFNLVMNQQRKTDRQISRRFSEEDEDDDLDSEEELELAKETYSKSKFERALSMEGAGSPGARQRGISLSDSHKPSKPTYQRGVSVTSAGSGAGGDKLKRGVSVVSNGEAGKEESKEELKDDMETVGMCELLSWNSKEWPYILLGIFSATVSGGAQPAYAILISKVLAVFLSCDEETTRYRSQLYSLIFLAVAGSALFSNFFQNFSFAVSGERLTERLRSKAFSNMLRQDISYFDDPRHSTGALTSRLATEASRVKGATGVQIGTIFQVFANIGVGLIIAFIYSWQLTLLILAFVPFLVGAGMLRFRLISGKKGGKENYEHAGKLAVDCIENIRTVQILRREETFVKQYSAIVNPLYRRDLKNTQAFGASFGFSQGTIFYAYAAIFYLGGYLVSQKMINFESMMIAFTAVIFGATNLGQITAFGPDYSKAVEAAAKLKALDKRQPTIEPSREEGETPESYVADVVFNAASFCYPTRPSVQVLKDLTTSVSAGKRLALVGSSGCGKSTSVALLERFYDPVVGSVTVGGKDVRSLNLRWLRQQIGLVSQEPILFDRSVAENIAYGDNSRVVSHNEIIEAARKANIHEFIDTLPMGYETRVGDKGTQMSGGQKQRIAIARALVRNPKILLLDEATSALDTESEKVVQAALDKAQEGRTSIVIAHRLTTIQDADVIAVIQRGHVTEVGTHSELMEKKGFYHKLQEIQHHNH